MVDQRAPQHLAALPERRLHQSEHRLTIDLGRWAPHDLDQRRLHVGAGEEHRGGHIADHPCRPPVRHLHADRSVGRVSGRRGQTLGHFFLHHHEEPLDRGHAHRADRRRGGWRRCTAGWRPRHHRSAPASSAAQSSVMASPSTTVTLAYVGDDVAQHGGEATIHLERRHRRPGLGQRQRQRTQPGPDLDHVIARSDTGGTGDAAHRVGIGDEVLPEIAAGRQSVLGQQLTNGGTGMRHRLGLLADLDRDGGIGEVGQQLERRPVTTPPSAPPPRPGRSPRSGSRPIARWPGCAPSPCPGPRSRQLAATRRHVAPVRPERIRQQRVLDRPDLHPRGRRCAPRRWARA